MKLQIRLTKWLISGTGINKGEGVKSYSEQLDSVPRELPALMRSLKVQEKAARWGLTGRTQAADVQGPEEFEELKRAYNEGNMEKITEEMGDLLLRR